MFKYHRLLLPISSFFFFSRRGTLYKYRVYCISCINQFNLNSLNKKAKCSVSVENKKNKKQNPFSLINVHTVSTSKEMVVSITLIFKCLLGRGNIYLCIYIYISNSMTWYNLYKYGIFTIALKWQFLFQIPRQLTVNWEKKALF